MPTIRSPRRGSMQFWPRVIAKRRYTSVRSWPIIKDNKPLGFAGYKAGMTHVIINDPKPANKKMIASISWPVTVIECPPVKIAAAVFYNHSKKISQVFSQNLDKELSRKISLPKSPKTTFDNISEFTDVKALVYTQPKLTGIGKKKPEVFEIAIGGSKEEKLNYVKERLGKEIKVSDVFKDGEQLDIHAVTKGKGYQGSVKRYGVAIRQHKAEKTKRAPANISPWGPVGHTMYRVAFAGKMGNHARTHYNQQLVKIGNDPKEINPNGGFLQYGLIKNDYVLVKGSISGTRNKIIRFNHAIRPTKYSSTKAPEIKYVSKTSKQ